MSISLRVIMLTGVIYMFVVFAPAGPRKRDGRPIETIEQRRVIYNEDGAPVRDSLGRRISYSRQELEKQSALYPGEPVDDSSITAIGARAIWSYAAFGSGIGKSNLVVARNGAHTEIYVGGSTWTFGDDNYWHALRYNPSTGEYDSIYASAYQSAGIRRIEVADVLGDSGREILVALADGRVQFFSQKTKESLGEISTAAAGLSGLDVADVDGDGENELILCASNLYVYSAFGVLEWSVPGTGGQDVVAGQLDSDPALEIAVTDGDVVDSGTRSVQWTWPSGFGHILEVADIDDDNMQELIVAESWYFAWAYDVDRGLPKWSLPVSLDIGAIYVGDIDGDSVQELLLGDGQWGDIHAYDTVSLAEEWSIGNPDHGVTDIAVGDVDQDGTREVLWGAGATSTGGDHLYVVDWVTQQFEWQNIHLDGPFIGPERGDLDGDGVAEIVVASWGSSSGYGSGRILVFDGTDLRLRAISDQIVSAYAWTGTHDLSLFDVDDDGELEILVASDRLYDGVIEIYDFDTTNIFQLKWTNATQPSGVSFYSVRAGDIDNDGVLEIVAGGRREHTGAEGVYVYVYNYATGDEEWHSLQMGEYWATISGLDLADVERDGSVEIIGMVDGGDLYIFDGPTKNLEAILPGTYTSLRIHNSKSVPLVFVGTEAGDLLSHAYVSGAYYEVYRQPFVSGSIDGFTLAAWAAADIWIGSNGTLRLAEPQGSTLWESSNYGLVFGERATFLPDVPVLVSAGTYSIVGFLVTPLAP